MRRAFGIGRADTRGSARLVRYAAQQGADAMKEREWTDEEREQRRQQAIELHLAKHLAPGYNLGPRWSDAELALLGTMSDEDVAQKVGRTADAVRRQRSYRMIPPVKDRRRKDE
jgi:hypothetical protein